MDNRFPWAKLPAFEAAARNESFALAAQELNLSAAAVSRQIKSLEERLKVPLFQRSHRKVHLTKAGEELLHTTQLMMRLMRDTTRKFEPRAKGRQIRIATDLAFAHFWLLPRLVSIQEAIGATIISVIASDDVDACLSDSVDIPIVYGGADWPGFNAEYLLEESIFPVCSPKYLATLGPVETPKDLLKGVLLDVTGGPDTWVAWSEWLSGFGVDAGLASSCLKFSSLPWSVQLARDSKGIALGWKYLMDDLLKEGSLVRPIPETVTTGRNYYILRRPHGRANSETETITHLLLNQAGEVNCARVKA